MSEIKYGTKTEKKTKNVSFRFSEIVDDKLNELSKASGLSKTKLVTQLIEIEFERYTNQR